MTFRSLQRQARNCAWIIAALVATTLVGCASVKMPAQTASAVAVESLRTANLAPATTGSFALASDKNPAMDLKLSEGLRGSSVEPANGSFSQQLKDQILADLKASGLYDENSKIVIEARLTDSKVDAAIGTGTARLAATFTVNRAGKQVFNKELAVEATWESSFVGAIAVPTAINQYMALYKAVAAKLFDDVDFRTALAK